MEGKGITFSFSKKVEKKNLQPSALRGSVLYKDVNTTETIESIEENVIKSNGPQQAELVIPLVEEDRATAIDALRKRVAQKKQASTAVVAKEESPANQDRELTLDERAEQALLQEARDYAAVTPQRDPGTIEGAGAAGEGAGECSTLDDYDEVGVECFGSAMLRGMGWNNDGVGRPKVRKVVAIVSAVNKTLSAVSSRAPASNSAAQGPEEDGLSLVKGAFVMVHQGRNKGTYGVVEEVEVEYILVRRALARSVGGEAVLREVPANVAVVTAAHYKNNSRLINKEMFDQAQSKDKLRSERRKKRRSSDSNDCSDADIKDKTNLDETLSLVKTEVLTDRATANLSLTNERVKVEPVEVQNISEVDPLVDGDNSNSNDKMATITSKQTLAVSSYKDVKEGGESVVTVSVIEKDQKTVLVDQTDSSLSGREENLRSDRNNSTNDLLNWKDRDGKYSSHRSDRQSPDRLQRLKQSPDRRRQSAGRRKQSPDRRRQSPDGRRQAPDRLAHSPNRRSQSPDRRRQSPDRRRQSPDRRRQSPDRRRQSPDRRRQSPDRRRQSPDRRSQSPDRRRQSPDRFERLKQSPDKRNQCPDRRIHSPDRLKRLRQSPDRRCHSPDRRKHSPGVQSNKSKTKGSSQSNDSPKSNEEERRCSKKSRSSNPDPSQHRKHDSQRKEVESRDRKEDYLISKYGDASSNAIPGVGSGKLLEGRACAPWVREGLTVRIISEDYRRGRYFKQKVRVLSVLTAASCECRTELGKVLRDVPPSCLETVIPKQQPRLVLVLRGQLSGQLAIILEQHKDDQEASVQLLEDRSVITRLGYEDICQYNR